MDRLRSPGRRLGIKEKIPGDPQRRRRAAKKNLGVNLGFFIIWMILAVIAGILD